MTTFDFGHGPVEVKRHMNPDGTEGGWVTVTAEVDSTCYIGIDAMVYDNARVYGYARVYDKALVSGNAQVSGNALVTGNARIFDNARVFGNAQIYGNARVFGDAQVAGFAQVFGNAWVFGDAFVFENAWVFENALVYGNARVYDKAQVYGNARVFEDAQIYGIARVLDNIWVSGNTLVYFDESLNHKSNINAFEEVHKEFSQMSETEFKETINESNLPTLGETNKPKETKKKLYCINCKYIKCYDPYALDCGHPTNMVETSGVYRSCMEPIETIQTLNKNNECKLYKKKWYKFWVK